MLNKIYLQMKVPDPKGPKTLILIHNARLESLLRIENTAASAGRLYFGLHMAHGCRTFEYFQQLSGNEVETTVNDSPGPKAESVYYFFFAEIILNTTWFR
jgi:hypothetical protein